MPIFCLKKMCGNGSLYSLVSQKIEPINITISDFFQRFPDLQLLFGFITRAGI